MRSFFSFDPFRSSGNLVLESSRRRRFVAVELVDGHGFVSRVRVPWSRLILPAIVKSKSNTPSETRPIARSRLIFARALPSEAMHVIIVECVC